MNRQMLMTERYSPATLQSAAIVILAFCASFATAYVHAEDSTGCRRLAEVTNGPDGSFRPPLSATVTGTGRAHFYSAPASQCIEKRTFLVPGDAVTVYKPYKKWYQVMYVSKTGEDFEGWVEEDRLRLGSHLGGD
ncbi:hypothetical protein WK53_28765 [Burkholderia ubonensis]|uniref:SH3 domain-containing protein n=2 Tax=Burkholderia ubonensis TaxID=101571 RepID=A0AAW3NHG9_9BURK|nr:hypothetical protein [Burkholderia ubonensis]KVT58037.1 hypothetical protein WK53_28765 [Burkholderia ubonensis]